MSVEHWYLLPVGCTIAILAMSSGISAGNFWVPVYLLWTGFEPPVAFWMALATMLCGYGSGVVRNVRQGTLVRQVIVQHLPFTIPAALIGGSIAPALNVSWLVLLFGLFVLGYGTRMLVTLVKRSGEEPERPVSDLSVAPGETSRISPRPPAERWSHRRSRSLRQRAVVRDGATALVGGILLGLITVGLGELLLPRLLSARKSLSPAEIVGSTVLLIFVTSLAAALARLNGSFLAALGEQRALLLGAMLFAGPGVVLGGQLGPMVARRLNAHTLRWYMAAILLLVGILMLVRFAALVVFTR
jgi:uncharacterized membrane protein YfcA